MTDLEKAARQALEALETECEHYRDWDNEPDVPEYLYEAITALRQALEQPDHIPDAGKMVEQPAPVPEAHEQEPVACVHIKDGCLVGSHRDQSKPFPDGQYGLWPIDTRPQARELLQEIARLHDRIKDLEWDVEFLLRPASKPLTDEQILQLVPGLYDCLCDPYDCDNSGDYYASIPKDMIRLARAIEAAHGIKEKNT